MKHKFEVYALVKQEDGKYEYEIQYSGNSMEIALETMFSLKKDGFNCVKLEWY